jgi:hypothetical protein
MQKFKILSLAALVSVSTFSFAASETFHFGALQTASGSACSMDNAGAVTGACDASNANIALGVVTVSGLLANSAVNVTVNGSSGSNVTFVSTVDIQNATGTHNAIADNTATAVTTNGSGDDLSINVYGTMTVDTDLTPGTEYTADYVVDVTFQ